MPDQEDFAASGVAGQEADLGDPIAIILDKLRQTVREAEALSSSMTRVPGEVVWKRPFDSPSIAELLWFVHLADEFRFRPVVEAMIAGREPRLAHINVAVLLETDPAPDDDLAGILDQLVQSRTKLLARLEHFSAEAWQDPGIFVEGVEVTGLRFAEGISDHDSEILREIGHRLLASNLR